MTTGNRLPPHSQKHRNGHQSTMVYKIATSRKEALWIILHFRTVNTCCRYFCRFQHEIPYSPGNLHFLFHGISPNSKSNKVNPSHPRQPLIPSSIKQHTKKLRLAWTISSKPQHLSFLYTNRPHKSIARGQVSINGACHHLYLLGVGFVGFVGFV